MEYVPQADDALFTTFRITRRVRRKLGMMTDGNKRPLARLEEIIDKEFDTL